MRTEHIFVKNKHIDLNGTKKYFEFYRAIIESFCSKLRSRVDKNGFLWAKFSKFHPTKINIITEDEIAEMKTTTVSVMV